jgi:hypothetical protein
MWNLIILRIYLSYRNTFHVLRGFRVPEKAVARSDDPYIYVGKYYIKRQVLQLILQKEGKKKGEGTIMNNKKK